MTKSDIGGKGYMQIMTSPPKIKSCVRFHFSLVFGHHSTSWALVNIPVVVSVQAWVHAHRLNSSTKIWYSNLVVSTQFHINLGVRHRFSKIFKHVVGLLFDLFNLCQLHVSYTKYITLFFKVFDQGKRLPLFAWWYWSEGV